tara:strand:- start:732 stop:3107 length:2376 start_codon:yes stop_codon:yes gene_type:complete
MKNYELNKGKFLGKTPTEYYHFNFPPDNFQLFGFDAIQKKHNCLITAHTGAGKTAVALYAIAKHLQEGHQVIYTSPIKTLSNQKYKELSEDFEDVGIMTGDIKINPSADLMIMTAEILRNAIMRKDNQNEDVYDWKFDSSKIKLVVLDEVHFINNKDRGMVWEEIITNLDPSIQLVMLSATIDGAEKLAKWVGNIKKITCHHIPTPFRPVPLKHYVFWNDKFHLILEGDSKWVNGNWDKVRSQVKALAKNRKLKTPKFYMEKLIKNLQEKDQLPANIFLLNKKLVEKTAEQIQTVFNTHEERKIVEKIWDSHLEKYKSIYGESHQWHQVKKLVGKGIGIHHSGLIPILKEIIEILYGKKLIKVLIATETFAMGVNMPTRTTIFTQLTKYDGSGRRLLNTEEYIQMAGRAGRRGIDTYGTVVILPGKYIDDERSIKMMMTGKPCTLNSKIKIDYNYLLKQLSNYEKSDSEISFVKYLLKNINNTYFGSELRLRVDFKKLKKNEILKELSEIKFDESILKKFIEIDENNNEIVGGGNTWIKLNKKLTKKLTNRNKVLLAEIEQYDKNIYSKVKNLTNQLKKITNEINFSSESIEKQILLLLDFVKKYNFVDENYNLTILGKIMAEVNECNPMILGYMIKNKIFSDMSFEEIVAMLSIFIDDLSLETESISNLQIKDDFKDKMYLIGDLVNDFMNEESKLNNKLVYPITSDWYLHTNLFSAVLEWSKGKQWSEIYHLYPTFEGNFIKNVLRLTNLIKNVFMIAKIIKDVNLINTLEGFEEKLIRDFVTTDSLYL